MIHRKPVPPDERCPRSRCIRRRATADGKLMETCAAHLGTPKRSRYGVRRVKDSTGREYQSKAEREGMAEFRLKEKAGEIAILGEQVRFTLYITANGKAVVSCPKLIDERKPGERIESYVADVLWQDNNGHLHVGDFKSGLYTPEFKRKARWMAACGWPVVILKR